MTNPFFMRVIMNYKVSAIGSDNKPQLEMKYKKPKNPKLKENANKQMSFQQYLDKEMGK